MAIATGTAAVIAAGIAAGGSVGGAALANKGQKSASKAQERSASEAIAFEREREANRKAQYDAAMAEYRQRYAIWEQARQALMRRYGGGGGRLTLGNVSRPGSMAARPMSGTPPMASGAGMTPQLMGTQRMDPQLMGARGTPRTLADFWYRDRRA